MYIANVLGRNASRNKKKIILGLHVVKEQFRSRSKRLTLDSSALTQNYNISGRAL